MVKKIIMSLDLSKASGLDCIPVVVLKNCKPELSYILADNKKKKLTTKTPQRCHLFFLAFLLLTLN